METYISPFSILLRSFFRNLSKLWNLFKSAYFKEILEGDASSYIIYIRIKAIQSLCVCYKQVVCRQTNHQRVQFSEVEGREAENRIIWDGRNIKYILESFIQVLQSYNYIRWIYFSRAISVLWEFDFISFRFDSIFHRRGFKEIYTIEFQILFEKLSHERKEAGLHFYRNV